MRVCLPKHLLKVDIQTSASFREPLGNRIRTYGILIQDFTDAFKSILLIGVSFFFELGKKLIQKAFQLITLVLLAAVIDRRRPKRENPAFLANLVKQALAAFSNKEQLRKNLEKEFGTLFLTQSRIKTYALVLDILISDNPVEMSCSERFGKHIDIFQHHSGTLPFADIVQLVDGTGDKQDTGHFHAQIGMI